MARIVRMSIVAFCAVVAASASAQEPQSDYDQCLAKAQGNEAMERCAKVEIARQEAQLKDLEGKLAAKAGEAKASFEMAQEAWRRFRAAQCAWDRAATQPGDSADFTEIDCLIGLTGSRNAELEARLDTEPEAQPKE